VFYTYDFNIKGRAIIKMKAFHENDVAIILVHIEEFETNLNLITEKGMCL
tara:strand:+ start:301 stop:450 length:150 start_codon:yes stop_codon:yes gene_type:complete